MKKFYILVSVAIIIVVLTTNCFHSRYSLIKDCRPNERVIKNSSKYTDHTPLTASDLRNMLKNDTSHYKIVIIYSYCCGPCREYMRDIYSPMYKALDTSECRMYFVLDDCGSLPWNADYMKNYNIKDFYYLRDDDPMFKEGNEHRLTNIANYATQPKMAFTHCYYVPLTLIINKEGKIKQAVEIYNDMTISTAYRLWKMVNIDSLTVQDLDYDKIDTIVLNGNHSYYMPGVDTTSFRTYKPKSKQMRYCTPDGVCK